MFSYIRAIANSNLLKDGYSPKTKCLDINIGRQIRREFNRVVRLVFGAKTPDAKPNMDENFVENNGQSGSALINSILNQPHTLEIF